MVSDMEIIRQWDGPRFYVVAERGCNVEGPFTSRQAFDALDRFNGPGVVVRVDDDGSRTTVRARWPDGGITGMT